MPIGADRIAADGSVANKVGSYPLVLAKYHHVPFIVVAPTTTVDLDTADGASISVERRPGNEVTELISPQIGVAGGGTGGLLVASVRTPAYNPAFDITPPELVDRHGGGRSFPGHGGSDWQSCVPDHRR